MKSRLRCALCAGTLLLATVPQQLAAAATAPTEEQIKAQVDAKLSAIERELHPQYGRVAIPAAKARLDLGDGYFFLPANEAKRVLTDAWGNPPDAVSDVLGMVFPAGTTLRNATWGAVIQYEETGHVSDKDAASQDYDSVLADMKSAEEESNKATVEQGYAAAHLIGWAQAPTYDARAKTLIWARNIKFDGTKENTLNYDVRTLGRTGVLSLNMVDSMSQLDAVRAAAKGLGKTVQFESGARYADFNPGSDRMADFGLAGLVAAGAGVVVAKKVGLIGLLIIFFKKALVLIIAGGVALAAWFRKRFGGGDANDAKSEESEQPHAENEDDGRGAA